MKISNLAVSYLLTLSASKQHASAFTFTHRSSTLSNNNVRTLFTSPRTPIPSFTTLSMLSTPAEKSQLKNLPNSAVEVTITATPQQTKSAYDKTLASASKNISIPGFRKGSKIPPQVLENAITQSTGERNSIKVQALNNLLGELVEPALKEEHGLDPIGQPVLSTKVETLAESFNPGESLEMTVRCDVWPEIKWKDVPDQEKPYFGLTGKYTRKPFNQEKFDAALNDLKERYAILSPFEEGRKLAMGDACTVDMVGYMANADGSKGDMLPNVASGDNVEIVMGQGKYMEGLVEGLLGASVGETREVKVAFPERLKNKTLAGKKATFDVTITQANHRTLPEFDDEFAAQVRPGLTAEALSAELRKAVDEEDAKEFINERNDALAKALSERMDMEVPDTLVTQQAREKYAVMMSEMRDQGMADDEIKKLITPENFLKYKDIYADGIIQDFKTSMAVDEIAKLESIEVPAYQVEEQLQSLKKEVEGDEEFDEAMVKSKVEATLQRRLVFDFLAEKAALEVEYEEEVFDEELMNKLAEESLEREKKLAAEKAEEEPVAAEKAEAEKAAAEKAEAEKAAAEKAEAEKAAAEKAEAEKAAAEKAEAEKAAAEKAEAEKAAAEEAEAEKAAAEKAEAERIAAEKAEAERLAAEELARQNDPKVKLQARKEAVTTAKMQPKRPEEEKQLAERYGSMDPEERAFNILLDLGMIEINPDPNDPDYYDGEDDEFCAENVNLDESKS